MKRKNLEILLIIALLSSCSHTYYFPNTQTVPLFTQEKEIQASASMVMHDLSTSIDANAAYAITNNIAATANISFTDEKQETASYLEGSLGYYKPINDFLIFETYVGLGHSSQSHYETFSDGSPRISIGDLKINKVFVQPNIGISFRFLDVAFSPRISCINYSDVVNKINIETTDITQMILYEKMDNLAQSSPTYLYEPTLTIRLGWKWVKVQYQFSRSYSLNNKYLELDNAYFSAGLLFTLGRKYSNTSK